LGAAAFQWINPKAWIMIVGYISAYVPAQAGWSDIVTLSLLFMVVGFPCICVWALLGDRLSLWLTAGSRRRWFNRSMGLLLALSVLAALLAD
ncbi:LysE family translocator, partial [Leptospira sp. SA-E8]|uniref:LysE family translocator n=1 Tax=Leptospira sp. SA-E8 TaxID=3422259 RepID=UPI003EBF0585